MAFVKEEQEFDFGFWDGADPAPLLTWLNAGPGTSWFLYTDDVTGNVAFIEKGHPLEQVPFLGSYALCLKAGQSRWVRPNPDFDDTAPVDLALGRDRFIVVADDSGVPAGYDPA